MGKMPRPSPKTSGPFRKWGFRNMGKNTMGRPIWPLSKVSTGFGMARGGHGKTKRQE